MKIRVINGPNLNLLDQRESSHYGGFSYRQLENMIREEALKLNVNVEVFQSNNENELIELLHSAENVCDGILLNPAGYGHSSVALRDAIASLKTPVLEVHLSNLHQREKFRQRTVTSPACTGQISGLREVSYFAGLYALKKIIEKKSS